MAPRCKIPLPAGSLNVAFKGDVPQVSGISEKSPMYGSFKIGYTVVELELGDGTILKGLGTHQLVAALTEHSDDPKRKLKMEMSLPAESEIVLAPGEHGLIIEDKFGKAVLTRIDSSSPLKKEIRVGMIVDTVKFADGYIIAGHSAVEINEALNSASNTRNRTLILKSPTSALSPRSGALPSNKTIEIPAGTCDEIGLKISGNVAKIIHVIPGSALDGQARAGYVIDSLSHPEGHEFCGLTSADLINCIDRTSGISGRVITLNSPGTAKDRDVATTKIMLPIHGSLDDFGIKVIGSPASIGSIDTNSPFEGMLFRGFRVQMCGWEDGTEFEDLDSMELEEVMEESSGLYGRYLYLENSGPSAPSVVDFDLPAGKLGAVFKGAPPTITRINDGSPLEGVVDVGMCADTLTLSNGTVYYEMSTMEFTNALKSTANEENRIVRFIQLEEVGLTPAPVVQMEDEMNVPLPTGKLSVMFKGNQSPALISRVKETSPLLGKLPPGMAVDYVSIKNRFHREMNATEVTDLLKSTSDVPGRVMKVRDPNNVEEFSKIPDELEVFLPTGKLGCTFTGSVPVAKSFRDGSPVTDLMPPGMFVDRLVMPDGYSRSGMNTRELVSLLGQLSEEEERCLVLKSIKTGQPSPRQEILPMEKTITLPTGKLGVSFRGRSYTRVTRIHEDSKLLGQCYAGMIVDSVTIPGGSTFTGMTSKESARVLADTKMVGGRIMTLKSPENTDMSVRNISTDDQSIGGTSQDMSAGFSTSGMTTGGMSLRL